MFVAALGGIAGVIVIGAINSDDEPERDNRYQDAQLLALIDEKQAYLDQKKKEKNNIKKIIKQKIDNDMQDIANEQEIGEYIKIRSIRGVSEQAFDNLAASTMKDLETGLGQQIADDERHLREIDELIRKINEASLKNEDN